MGYKVREARKAANMTQEELAQKAVSVEGQYGL